MKFKKKIFISLILVLSIFMLNSAPVFSAEVNDIDADAQSNVDAQFNVEAISDSDFTNITTDVATLNIHSLNKNECMIAEYVNADDFNKSSHVSRLADEEKLDTYVFLNADGTKSVYYMDEKVKFVDKNGDVKEKDISLVSKSDGYGITCNEFDLHLPTSASSGITMSYNGYDVKIIPQTTVKAVPAKIENGSVVYDGFFGTDTSLKYTPALSGLKEDVIMKAYVPNASFGFILDTDGLGVYNKDGEYYLAENESSKAVLNLGKVIIYDAIGKPVYGTMTVTTVTKGQKYKLSLSAPEDFLKDPTTVYPVTIDPSLTVSDNDTGNGAIADTVLYSNRPDINYGGARYLSIGYVDSTYGVGRVAVKLPGLYNSSQYVNASDTEILSVKFYCRDSSGNSAQQVNLYRLTGIDWDENTVTANSSMSYNTTPNMGTTMSSSTWTAFDITALAKAWKTVFGVVANRGFILINSNETSASCKKAPFSSEYSNPSYRPYVVMVYDTTLTLNYTNVNAKENSSFNMTASINSTNTSVTWKSSNTAVATINSSGVVTTKKAGTTVITATHTANNGTKYTADCTLYVRINDGVYYIQNTNSSYYAHVSGGGIANGINVFQYEKYPSTTSDVIKIRQMWKIKYLSAGRYSVRPLHILSSGLHVTNTNVDIYNIGTTDTRSGVSDSAEWVIEWDSTAYLFKNNGESGKTMQIENASTSAYANIIVSSYSAGANCKWNLSKVSSPPVGAYLYDTENEYAITTTTTKNIVYKQSNSLNDIGIKAIYYSGDSIDQTFSWSSSNTSVVTVDSNDGTVYARSCGTATITAMSNERMVSYILRVVPIPDGTYLLKNKETKKFVDIDEQIMDDGTQIHQWEYHTGNTQRWIFTHIGNGYYTITSAHSSVSYYLGVSCDSNENEAPIVLRTGTITDGMKWRISLSSSGAYVITPKIGENNNKALTVGTYILNVNGIDIEQGDYACDTNYKDEWFIITPQPTIGFSTDNYTDGCDHEERNSFRYANTFFDELNLSGEFVKIHNYNKDSHRTASKEDFSINGAISNDIDFMIYIGHGLLAEDVRGNRLHYNCSVDGIYHTEDHENALFNAYGRELHFGSRSSNLRWAWLYTCNFLTTNDYVTDNTLREMMTGVHIVMGYSSKSYLCDSMALKFSTYLHEGEPIIQSYFQAGHYGEASATSDDHYQKVMYIPQAELETIYSPRIYYDYSASDVLIYERCIQSDYD